MSVTRDSGTRKGQAVNSLGMAHGIDVTYSIAEYYASKGHAYNFNTGNITLTSGSESSVAYIENSEDEDLIVTLLVYLLGGSTGGAAGEEHLVQIMRNPTAVSYSTAQAPVNRNCKSFNTLNGNFYKGAEAATSTAGTVMIESVFSSEGRQTVNVGAVVVGKGNSIAIDITPKASNTSMVIQAAVGMYLDKDNLLGA